MHEDIVRSTLFIITTVLACTAMILAALEAVIPSLMMLLFAVGSLSLQAAMARDGINRRIWELVTPS